MTAGQTKTFILEFDWARECITPDWSLVAMAEKGEVVVSHLNGYKSDTLPYTTEINIKQVEEVQTTTIINNDTN